MPQRKIPSLSSIEMGKIFSFRCFDGEICFSLYFILGFADRINNNNINNMQNWQGACNCAHGKANMCTKYANMLTYQRT